MNERIDKRAMLRLVAILCLTAQLTVIALVVSGITSEKKASNDDRTLGRASVRVVTARQSVGKHADPADSSLIVSQQSRSSNSAAMSVASGEQIDWQVFSGGGKWGTTSSYRLGSTMGQTATGGGVSATYGLHHGFWKRVDSVPPSFDDCGYWGFDYFGCFTFTSDHHGIFAFSCDADLWELVGHIRVIGDIGGDCCVEQFFPCLVCREVLPCDYCCGGMTGNVDCDPQDIVDLGDLTRLIDYLFISFDPLCCPEEANIDGDPEGLIDLGDLTALIDYLFISFTPPAECR